MKYDYVKKADEIQRTVGKAALSGYDKKGRVFNRLTGDSVSVVEFVIGRKYNDENYMLFVKMGLFLPQPALRSLDGSIEPGKFYYEYECWLRTSIGSLQDIHVYQGYNDKFFDMNVESPEKIAEEICRVIRERYLPDIEKLNTVEKALQNAKCLAGEEGKKRWWSSNFELDSIFLHAAAGDMASFICEFQSYYNSVKLKSIKQPHLTGHMDYLVHLAEKLKIELIP